MQTCVFVSGHGLAPLRVAMLRDKRCMPHDSVALHLMVRLPAVVCAQCAICLPVFADHVADASNSCHVESQHRQCHKLL
jgi:hypothetical protein